MYGVISAIFLSDHVCFYPVKSNGCGECTDTIDLINLAFRSLTFPKVKNLTIINMDYLTPLKSILIASIL